MSFVKYLFMSLLSLFSANGLAMEQESIADQQAMISEVHSDTEVIKRLRNYIALRSITNPNHKKYVHYRFNYDEAELHERLYDLERVDEKYGLFNQLVDIYRGLLYCAMYNGDLPAIEIIFQRIETVAQNALSHLESLSRSSQKWPESYQQWKKIFQKWPNELKTLLGFYIKRSYDMHPLAQHKQVQHKLFPLTFLPSGLATSARLQLINKCVEWSVQFGIDPQDMLDQTITDSDGNKITALEYWDRCYKNINVKLQSKQSMDLLAALAEIQFIIAALIQNGCTVHEACHLDSVSAQLVTKRLCGVQQPALITHLGSRLVEHLRANSALNKDVFEYIVSCDALEALKFLMSKFKYPVSPLLAVAEKAKAAKCEGYLEAQEALGDRHEKA